MRYRQTAGAAASFSSGPANSKDSPAPNGATEINTPKPTPTPATSPSVARRRRGPVPINKTPRGLAAAKIKPLLGGMGSSIVEPATKMEEQQSTATDSSGSASSATSSGIHSSETSTTTSQQQPATTSTIGNNSNDTTTSAAASAVQLLKGGTPCDPSPPPFHLAEYGEGSLYTLILLRHGESEWNSQNRYTGWCDVNLTKRGEMEARAAGRLLAEHSIEVDHAFTSVLKRASFSTNMCLNMAKQHWVPVTKTWRLNERHYGALQGYNKDTAYADLNIDQELVMQMRRSYDTQPPIMKDDHPYWHGLDRRYKKLSKEQLDASRAESLKDAAKRILPFYQNVIVPSIRAGNKCLVVSHANTIRTLIKHIDGISDENIKGMSIPTGIPLLYRLDANLKPVDPNSELEFQYMVEPKGYTWGTSRAHGFHGVYLGDLERLQEIQKKRDITNRDWQRIILRNIARDLVEEDRQEEEEEERNVKINLHGRSRTLNDSNGSSEQQQREAVFETRQLWWKLHMKMQQEPEYENMLLLMRMKDHLERLLFQRKQRVLTMAGYLSIVNKLHLDAAGEVVQPFKALKDEQEERQRIWYENLALDLEEECLIK